MSYNCQNCSFSGTGDHFFTCNECSLICCIKKCCKNETLTRNGLSVYGTCKKCFSKEKKLAKFYKSRVSLIGKPFQYVSKESPEQKLNKIIEEFQLEKIDVSGKILTTVESFRDNIKDIVTVVFSQTKNDTKNIITLNLGLSGDGGYHENSTYLTIDFGNSVSIHSTSRTAVGFFKLTGDPIKITYFPEDVQKTIELHGKFIVNKMFLFIEDCVNEQLKSLYEQKEIEKKRKQSSDDNTNNKKSKKSNNNEEDDDNNNDKKEEDVDSNLEDTKEYEYSKIKLFELVINMLAIFRYYRIKTH